MGKRTALKTVDKELQLVLEDLVIMGPYTYFYSLYARLEVANLSCCTKTIYVNPSMRTFIVCKPYV